VEECFKTIEPASLVVNVSTTRSDYNKSIDFTKKLHIQKIVENFLYIISVYDVVLLKLH